MSSICVPQMNKAFASKLYIILEQGMSMLLVRNVNTVAAFTHV